MAAIAAAPRLLSEAGVDAVRLARDCAIAPERFADPELGIGIATLGRYLAACEHACRDDSFALRTGIAAGASALHAVGYLALNAPDVRRGLQLLVDHTPFSGAVAELRQTRDVVSIKYEFLHARIGGAQLISEGAIGIAIAILRQMCGSNWRPLRVQLVRRASTRTAAWRKALGVAPQFGAGKNTFSFEARWLDQPIANADPQLYRILQQRSPRRAADPGTDITLQAESAIRAALLAGDVRSEAIAQRLGLRVRTLRRHLGEHDADLATLLQRSRSELARQWLQDPALSLARIAEMLGYAHSSAFSRAFRAWTGVTPRQWRADHLARDTPRAK